jgi:hypothetical protein
VIISSIRILCVDEVDLSLFILVGLPRLWNRGVKTLLGDIQELLVLLNIHTEENGIFFNICNKVNNYDRNSNKKLTFLCMLIDVVL